jgi:hypothetical protein
MTNKNSTCQVFLHKIMHTQAILTALHLQKCGPGSSVDIVTGYGLDDLGTESQWGREFSHMSRHQPWGPPASCTMGTGPFLGVKWPGRGANQNPTPPVPRSRMSRAIPLLPLSALGDIYRVNFTFYFY